MATHTKKPATTLRCGGINASIWMNPGANGVFYNTTLPVLNAMAKSGTPWRHTMEPACAEA